MIYLIIAILLEVAGTTAMKLSEGFTKVIPSVFMVVFYLCSLGILNLALKKIDVSSAYAIWSGVGTALIAIVGMLYFKEPVSWLKLASIVAIIAGVVGLQLAGVKH